MHTPARGATLSHQLSLPAPFLYEAALPTHDAWWGAAVGHAATLEGSESDDLRRLIVDARERGVLRTEEEGNAHTEHAVRTRIVDTTTSLKGTARRLQSQLKNSRR